jgi:hypothetical protein
MISPGVVVREAEYVGGGGWQGGHGPIMKASHAVIGRNRYSRK